MHKSTNLNKLDRNVKPLGNARGVIVPPRKNAAKSAFAAQRPRLKTTTVVKSRGPQYIVPVPSKLGV